MAFHNLAFANSSQKGLYQKQISKLLRFNKQKVSYWVNHDIKTVQSRRKKLPLPSINKICNLAKDRTTNDMGAKK